MSGNTGTCVIIIALYAVIYYTEHFSNSEAVPLKSIDCVMNKGNHSSKSIS